MVALVDEKGNARFCYRCKLSSLPKDDPVERPIVDCTKCSARWHLDCIDPPITHMPQGLVRRWVCPLHVEGDLEISALLAPAHRNRLIKNAPIIEPVFTRGMANNGHIEIIDDLDDLDEEDDHIPQQPSKMRKLGARSSATSMYPAPDSFGRVHKISASKIALDFLEK